MFRSRNVGCSEQHIRINQQHADSDAFGRLRRRKLRTLSVDVERLGATRGSDADEAQPILCCLGRELGRQLGDDFVQRDAATSGLS
jgi:hypothetical protein